MRAPDFWRHDGALARLLSPLAFAWQLAGSARRATTTPRRVGVPVLCVGNLVAGGAGKTPVVLALLELLAARGLRPAVLTRGYGGSSAGPLLVDASRHDAALVGDEALLLARAAPTWMARDRLDGAREAVEEGSDIIVMDDGFQNPGLSKDFSLLVIDSGYGLGNARVMPAGPLRETAAAGLARADAVVLIGETAIGETEKNLIDSSGLPLLRARFVPRDHNLAGALKGQRVYAFAGIGRPGKFFETLTALGAELAGHEAFADHKTYNAATLRRLEAAAAAAGARLVTTAKDAARLGPALPDGVAVLDVELQWEDKGALLHLLEPHLPAPEAAAPMTPPK
jgi:tetraacyldisaccharide 4'-kinase